MLTIEGFTLMGVIIVIVVTMFGFVFVLNKLNDIEEILRKDIHDIDCKEEEVEVFVIGEDK